MSGVIIGATGCQARLQLSGARSMEQLAGAIETASQEYHAEIRTSDDYRRRLVINDFVRRLQSSMEDETTTRRHVTEFNAALDRIRDDAEVENGRYIATLENLRGVREVADGLKRAALAWMAFGQDVDQYVHQEWLDRVPAKGTELAGDR